MNECDCLSWMGFLVFGCGSGKAAMPWALRRKLNWVRFEQTTKSAGNIFDSIFAKFSAVQRWNYETARVSSIKLQCLSIGAVTRWVSLSTQTILVYWARLQSESFLLLWDCIGERTLERLLSNNKLIDRSFSRPDSLDDVLPIREIFIEDELEIRYFASRLWDSSHQNWFPRENIECRGMRVCRWFAAEIELSTSSERFASVTITKLSLAAAPKVKMNWNVVRIQLSVCFGFLATPNNYSQWIRIENEIFRQKFIQTFSPD